MPETRFAPIPHRLAQRLRRELEGEVLFDRFSRGRYATDASHYQIEPVGVVVPKSDHDVRAAMAIAREEGVPLLPRGGATSQSGQTVGHCLVMDFSKYLRRLLAVDSDGERCVVEPGIVLDDLNRQLKPTGLWFPVDVSTASRATIGGMTGNNSCGTRSIRYGIMRDNVSAIAAILADGSDATFGEVGRNLAPLAGAGALTAADSDRNQQTWAREGTTGADLERAMLALGRREAAHIAQRTLAPAVGALRTARASVGLQTAPGAGEGTCRPGPDRHLVASGCGPLHTDAHALRESLQDPL